MERSTYSARAVSSVSICEARWAKSGRSSALYAQQDRITTNLGEKKGRKQEHKANGPEVFVLQNLHIIRAGLILWSC